MAEIGTYSEVALANLALQAQGRGAQVTDISENTQPARIIKANLPYSRDAVLRAFPWNFAKRRTSLAALATAPAFGFSAAFALPVDCIRVVGVYLHDQSKWRVEGREILIDDSGPISIKYIARITDLGADPLFFTTLAARIAADTALAITESSSKAEQLWRVYMQKLREARAIDSQEGQAEDWGISTWDAARHSGIQNTYRDWNGE